MGQERQPGRGWRLQCVLHIAQASGLRHLLEISSLRASEVEKKYFTIRHHKMLLTIELPKRCLVFEGTGEESKWADTVRNSYKCAV